MRRILFISLAAAGLVGAWSSCFVAKGKEATTSTTSTSGTGGAGGTATATTSSRATTTTSGAGGQPGAGGFGQGGFGEGGFGGVPAIDVVCNPVTNANCSGGDACGPTVGGVSGVGALNGFACYPGPTAIKACGDCDLCLPAPCAPGFICLPTNADDTTAQCARYCCSDADCGALGSCSVNNTSGVPLFGAVSTTLGVCVSKFGALDAGTEDGGDAGSTLDAGVVSAFACDPPATAPSTGQCVMLTL